MYRHAQTRQLEVCRADGTLQLGRGAWDEDGDLSGRPDDISKHTGCDTHERVIQMNRAAGTDKVGGSFERLDLSRDFSSMQQWSVALPQKLKSILQIRQTTRARDGNTTARSPTSLQRRLVRPDPARQLTSRRTDTRRRAASSRGPKQPQSYKTSAQAPKPATRSDQSPLTWKSRTASDASAPGPAPRPSRG